MAIKNIISDFEINKNSINEFIRIVVPELDDQEIFVKTLKEDEKEIKLNVKVNNKSVDFEYRNIQDKIKDQKIVMVKVGLMKLYKKKPYWGSMIGVRVTKKVRNLLDFGFNYEEIKEILVNFYLIFPEKVDLLIEIVKTELKYLNRDNINIYIGIPFCPTKCHYCSFASYEKKGAFLAKFNDFLEALHFEIREIGKFVKEKNISIESIYIGGGTPSILSEEELESLLKEITESFDFTNIKEFNFEAGRIDTTTKEKLDIAKKYKIDRISLNPQTFNEKTLILVNRKFDQEKFDDMFQYANDLGLIVNMDFIIGLPEESVEDIINSLEKIKKYEVENLTIHYLALKRASKLFKEGAQINDLDYIKITNKIKEITKEKKLHPYYMYRQKNSVSWGENIGYSIKGKESIFNIEMIEEYQDTIGIGGGAISKIIKEKDKKVTRLINPKDPIVYLNELKDRLVGKIKMFEEEQIAEK